MRPRVVIPLVVVTGALGWAVYSRLGDGGEHRGGNRGTAAETSS